MSKQIKIKCPAKINLDLKVFPKDPISGFHPIESIMQAINLFDYLTLEITDKNSIELNGNSKEIPYDEKNICYKAVSVFQEYTNTSFGINIYIEKNIPVCAGLAGGSTDAAGVLFGINKFLDMPLNKNELHFLCQKLGSDLNFCLEGGKKLCKGRGEKLEEMPFEEFDITLVKPKNLQISAKEAYFEFDSLNKTPNIPNYLEFALLDKYEELKYLNSHSMQMSGSGPTYFIKEKNINFDLDKNKYLIIPNLKTINHGVCIVS
ncbi:4-(cytidine 5'-diphospho)-2-C-methyl-D-erythritol kinase [bacterium]|nr:4-(cytidine 5'-diphospho)-2-C-methyl-D-erythritol kinase [bacterium]